MTLLTVAFLCGVILVVATRRRVVDISVRHDVYFHKISDNELSAVLLKLVGIEGKVDQIMATEAELFALLEEANAVTNEIADDLAEVLAREPEAPPTEEPVEEEPTS